MTIAGNKQAWDQHGAQPVFSIGDLAKREGITTRAVRFYEERGFLKPLKRGRTRFFTQADATRLKLVMRGKRLGFSLDEIAEIVFMYDAEPGEAGQLRLLIDKIAERRAELLEKQRDIETTLAEISEVEARCLDRLADMEKCP